MKKLYSGFDLCKPTTSVSMTINGPAPMLLAMFMNTAIDQRIERFLKAQGRWPAAEKHIATLQAAIVARGAQLPKYSGDLPEGHDGSGLALLGIVGRELIHPGVLTAEEFAKLRAEAMSLVRGTVQADILKEDQAQNTCIFSTEFAMRMMGDVQQFFIDNARAQLLFRVDLRLSHCRSRRESGQPARVHVVQRLHDRRVLPLARHEDR